MSHEVVIKVQNLSKNYKLYDASIDRMKEAMHPFKKKYHQEFPALSNINFEVRKGETVGIVGKNGAGKSTLLKIITGVLTPTCGSVYVHGRVSALLELGAGFHAEYTGIENIYFHGNIMGIERSTMQAKIDAILAFADIGKFVHQPVKNYSSGMFARLAFAVAIHVEPEILIIDEALAVGDANFQIKCHKRMDELRANGVSILFVSHDTYSVKTLCSKAVFLNHGTQVSFGHSLDVVNDYLLFLDSEHQKGTEKKGQCATASAIDAVPPSLPAKIHRVAAVDVFEQEPGIIKVIAGSNLRVLVDYEIYSADIDAVVLVFNIYRERDGVYVCGTTSLMDGIEPLKVKPGTHQFEFMLQSIPLLSGKYRIRVAINEKKGLGILTELNDALFINVTDNHEAEGLVNLNRTWLL